MLRLVDGYEHYGAVAHALEGVGGAAAWSQVDTANWALSTANPATGTYHFRMTNTGSGDRQIRRAYGASKQVVGLGYRFSVNDLPDSESQALVMADFRDASNGAHCMVIMGTEGSVVAVRGGNITAGTIGGTVLGRSDPCIAAGGYHHFECKVKIDNSVGYIEVRINEVTVLNLTGIDTQNTGNATAAQFAIGRSDNWAAESTSVFDIDDVFAWDDDAGDAENTVVDFVGDKGCYFLPVTADTAEADWLKSTGVTGYELLNEVPPSGGDYISDSTGAARSIFEVGALPGNVSEIIAFMPVIYARKEESGTVNIRGGVVVGAEESYTPTNSPSTDYAYMEPGPKTIDPDTGVAWASDANPDLLIERTA